MSEEENSGRNNSISVAASTDFENDDAALEALVELKEVEFGTVFEERDTTIGSEDEEGISIQFENTDWNNYLRIYTTGGGHVHMVLNLDERWIEEAHDILSTVSDEIGTVELQDVNATMYLELAFESLRLPFEEDSDFSITGIRITEPDANYIIQDVAEGTFVNRNRRLEDENELEKVDRVGEADIEAIEQYIERFE